MMNVPRGQKTETSHKKNRRGTGKQRRKHLADAEDRRDSWTREDCLHYATNSNVFAEDVQSKSCNKASTSTSFASHKKTRRGTANKRRECVIIEEDPPVCVSRREEFLGNWHAPIEASRDIHQESDIQKDYDDSESRAIDERFVKVHKEFSLEIRKRLAAKERENLRTRARMHQG